MALLHIHRLEGDPCIACGDLDDSSNLFLTDPGAWNREARSCSPSTRVRPDYSLSGRDDPRTSALKDERMPDRKKVRDLR